jgi:hypothetical protein
MEKVFVFLIALAVSFAACNLGVCTDGDLLGSPVIQR